MNGSNKRNIKMFTLPARFYFWLVFSLFFLVRYNSHTIKFKTFTTERFSYIHKMVRPSPLFNLSGLLWIPTPPSSPPWDSTEGCQPQYPTCINHQEGMGPRRGRIPPQHFPTETEKGLASRLGSCPEWTWKNMELAGPRSLAMWKQLACKRWEYIFHREREKTLVLVVPEVSHTTPLPTVRLHKPMIPLGPS